MSVTMIRAHRDHGERHERRDHRQHRRDVENHAVAAGRNEFLLEQELHDVGPRLEDAGRPDPVGARATLHAPRDLALEQNHVGHDYQHAVQDHEDLEERPEHELESGFREAVHAGGQSSHSRARFLSRYIADEQDQDEQRHLDQSIEPELSERHRPRVEEHRLDVEQDEQHRHQVELTGTGPGGADRLDAALVGRACARSCAAA
jgi:hypothetical protein